MYEAPGQRWRSTCLIALTGAQRRAELQRLARAMASGARADGALGDEPVQLEALQAWAARAGAAEAQAYTEATLRPLWCRRSTREYTQARILAMLAEARRRADPNPALAHLLLTNAAFLGDDAGFRERLAVAEASWVSTLPDDGFWPALTAWAQLVPARDLTQALRTLGGRCRPGEARERLRGLAELPSAERRARVAEYAARSQGAEAAWWRFASDAFGRGHSARRTQRRARCQST